MNSESTDLMVSKPASSGGALGLELSEVLRALYRRKWIVALSALVIGAAAFGGTLRQRKIYAASAQIMIDPALPNVLDQGDGFENLSELSRAEQVFNNTQYQTIKSSMVLRRATASLELQADQAFLDDYKVPRTSADLLDAVAKSLETIVTVEPQRGSRIVKISVEDYDPVRVARVANAIAQAYQDYVLDRRLETTRSAYEWLDKRVAEYASKLEQAEQALHQFKKDNMLLSVSLEDRQNMTGSKLSTLSQKLVEVNTQLISARARRDVLIAQRDANANSPESTPFLSENPVVVSVKGTQAELRKQRAELVSRYGERHPKMQEIDTQIVEMSNLLRRETQVVVDAVLAEITALEETSKGLAAAVEEEKVAAMSLNELALQYGNLSRDYGTTKATYEQLLKRQTEADLSTTITSNFAHWFERAEPPMLAAKPSVPKNTGVGLFLGLVLGVLIVVGGVLLDNTVQTQADLEQLTGATFLGILPSIAQKEEPKGAAVQQTRDLYIAHNTKSAPAECARSIRTNILFMSTDRPLRKFLVTSPGPSEGKSTIAVNLSVVMAQAGNRVLLVDTDLRRPRLHRAFGVSGETGLTSVLLSACSLEHAIRSTEVKDLDLLPCGPLPPNPAELLHSERFLKLIEELSDRYDRVIFDSPPVNAVTDASILAQAVDGAVIVAKAGQTAKDALRRAHRQLDSVHAHIIGAVMNDVDMENGTYGHHYYYYRRYGYGYGADAEKGAEV